MTYRIDISLEADHVRAVVAGQRRAGREVDDAAEFWSRIAEACRAHQVHAIVAVIDLGGRLSSTSAFEIANHIVSLGLTWPYRIAVVDRNELSYQDNLFAETVAVNRGVHAKVFRAEAEALAWLRGAGDAPD